MADQVIREEVPGGLPGVSPHRGLWWGSLFAGMLAALSIFALLSVLGMAVGFSASGAVVGTGFAVGYAVWMVILSIICFCIGGFIAVRASGTRGDASGLIHGMMVWALAVPILTLGLIFASMSNNTATSSGSGAVVLVPAQQAAPPQPATGQAAATPSTSNNQVFGYAPAQAAPSNAIVQGLSWSLFFSLLLGLCAACVGGLLASRTRERREIGPAETGHAV